MWRHLFSVDWGTSRLRVRLVDRDARVLASATSDDGVGAIAAAADGASRPARFASTLRRILTQLKHGVDAVADAAPVVISGMAGSSIGWRPLPYASLPFPLDGSRLEHCNLGPLGDGHGGDVILVSGVRSDDDVIRGEETEAIGLLQSLQIPAKRFCLVLPGTHSKHMFVDDGVLTGFRTHMTGELFDLLCRHSVLQHSMTSDGGGDEGFDAGVRAVAAGAEPLTAALFRVRTRELLDRAPPAANREYLSGLMIGTELKSLVSTGQTVWVASGNASLATRYERAADMLGLRRASGPTPDAYDLAVVHAHLRIASIIAAESATAERPR